VAWDTARTRRLLLDAAIAEFAEHGLHGARVAAIAARAGVNKERIYEYFGNKDELFAAVRDVELAKLPNVVQLTPEAARDLGEYAGCIFDYHSSHPELLRLLHWEGLEALDQPLPSATERAESYAARAQAIRDAQAGGYVTASIPADRMLYGVIAIASWWFAAPQVAGLLFGPAHKDLAAQREALVAMVRRLSAPDREHS
jgi:AcrR family transcriptional regulator